MMESTRRTGTLRRLFAPGARRRTILLAALALVALGTAAGIYRHYLAPTRIAFVNFRGVQLARLERARGDQAVRIEPIALDALHRAASYPVVFIHGRGLELQETHIEQLREAGRRGARLFVRGVSNPEHDVTNLEGRQLDHVGGYFRFGGTENYARLLNYSRAELDGKAFRSDPVQPPAERAMDVLFHLDDRRTFETVDDYRAYYAEQGLAKPDAPTIASSPACPVPSTRTATTSTPSSGPSKGGSGTCFRSRATRSGSSSCRRSSRTSWSSCPTAASPGHVPGTRSRGSGSGTSRC